MRKMKRFTALAAGSIAICMTLGTSTALAQEVCVDGETVIGIKNLEVATDTYGLIDIDVDFRYTTGFEIYGSDLNDLPFGDPVFAEEDAGAVELQINNTLDLLAPNVPDFAGQPGENAYFIGLEGEVELGKGLLGVWGSENTTGDFWDPCTELNDCILGVGALGGEQRATFADLSRASGGTCTGSPPPDPGPGYTIVPCITGSWYDPARDGEGYNIEITGSSLDPQVLAYFYTYDENGDQMWLVGSGPADGDTAVVPVQLISGPVYGDGYDPDDRVIQDWGTLTFTFDTKDTGSVVRASTTGFGTTTEDIFRLTYVTGLTCQ